MSDSGSFIEDDNHEQLTIQNIDPIKIMVDVEDDVKNMLETDVANDIAHLVSVNLDLV